MQRPKTSSGFEQQLDAYSATSRSIASASNWRDRLGSWPIYAAATASALACSTSASAGIIYSGPLNLSTPALANYANADFSSHYLNVAFPGAAVLDLVLTTSLGHGTREARVNGYLFSFLRSNAHPARLALLASNAPISTVPGHQDFGLLWEENSFGHVGNWGPGNPATGFAGFRFKTSAGSSSYDYGWLQLSVTANGDGYPTEETLIQYAYNTTAGAPIETGTPEPSTKALMLLAAGFAGLMAWRRRKTTAALAGGPALAEPGVQR